MENSSVALDTPPQKSLRLIRMLIYSAVILAFCGWGLSNFPILLFASILAIPLGLAGEILALLRLNSMSRLQIPYRFPVILLWILATFSIVWELANLYSMLHSGELIWGFFRTVDLIYQPPLKV